MSIAVSAVVKPSRLLRSALSIVAVASAGAAVALVAGAPGRFHVPWLLAGACLGAAAAAWRAGRQHAFARLIDISGLGEIRLTVQQSMGETAPRAPLQLLPGSTVWPGMLLLLLRDAEQGGVTVLTIFPDCMPDELFRKIAVSIKAIARRDNKFLEKNRMH